MKHQYLFAATTTLVLLVVLSAAAHQQPSPATAVVGLLDQLLSRGCEPAITGPVQDATPQRFLDASVFERGSCVVRSIPDASSLMSSIGIAELLDKSYGRMVLDTMSVYVARQVEEDSNGDAAGLDTAEEMLVLGPLLNANEPMTPTMVEEAVHWLKRRGKVVVGSRRYGDTVRGPDSGVAQDEDVQLKLDAEAEAALQRVAHRFVDESTGAVSGENWLGISNEIRSTLILRDVDGRHPYLYLMSLLLRYRGAWLDSGQSLYYTPAGAKSTVPPHIDTMDVLAIQLMGGKVWSLHQSITAKALPLRDVPALQKRHYRKGSGSVAGNVTLLEGDALYVPRGMIHNTTAIRPTDNVGECSSVGDDSTDCASGNEGKGSVHLSVGLEPVPRSTALAFLLHELTTASSTATPTASTPRPLLSECFNTHALGMMSLVVLSDRLLPLRKAVRIHPSFLAPPCLQQRTCCSKASRDSMTSDLKELCESRQETAATALEAISSGDARSSSMETLREQLKTIRTELGRKDVAYWADAVIGGLTSELLMEHSEVWFNDSRCSGRLVTHVGRIADAVAEGEQDTRLQEDIRAGLVAVDEAISRAVDDTSTSLKSFGAWQRRQYDRERAGYFLWAAANAARY